MFGLRSFLVVLLAGFVGLVVACSEDSGLSGSAGVSLDKKVGGDELLVFGLKIVNNSSNGYCYQLKQDAYVYAEECLGPDGDYDTYVGLNSGASWTLWTSHCGVSYKGINKWVFHDSTTTGGQNVIGINSQGLYRISGDFVIDAPYNVKDCW